MVHGNIEKSLDLRSMQINNDATVSAGLGQQICDHLGGNGRTRLVFAVLARVAEVGDHRGHPLCRCSLQGVDHQQ